MVISLTCDTAVPVSYRLRFVWPRCKSRGKRSRVFQWVNFESIVLLEVFRLRLSGIIVWSNGNDYCCVSFIEKNRSPT